MLDLFRETAFGQLLNSLSNGRILPYPEQRSDFTLPAKYLAKFVSPNGDDNTDSDSQREENILIDCVFVCFILLFLFLLSGNN